MIDKNEVDRVRIDDFTWSVKCIKCGKTFYSRRSDACFCSARCRMRESREPQKRANALETLRYAGIDAERIAKKYRHDDEVYNAMKKLANELSYALSLFEEK